LNWPVILVSNALFHREAIPGRMALPGNLADMVSDVNRQMTRDIEKAGGFMTLFYRLKFFSGRSCT
jgi:hypothetical protein